MDSDAKGALARSIREQRQRKGWTQAELAEQLNVNSTSTIGNWENGVAMPDIDRLSFMADLFEVSVDKLLGRVACEKPVIPTSEKIDPKEREVFETMWEWFIDLDDAGQRTVYNCIEFQHKLIQEAGPITPNRKAKERYQPLFLVEGKDSDYDEMKKNLPYLRSLRKTTKKSYIDITKFLWGVGYGDEICLLFVREIFGRGLNDKVPCQRLYDDIEKFLKDKYVYVPLP